MLRLPAARTPSPPLLPPLRRAGRSVGASSCRSARSARGPGWYFNLNACMLRALGSDRGTDALRGRSCGGAGAAAGSPRPARRRHARDETSSTASGTQQLHFYSLAFFLYANLLRVAGKGAGGCVPCMGAPSLLPGCAAPVACCCRARAWGLRGLGRMRPLTSLLPGVPLALPLPCAVARRLGVARFGAAHSLAGVAASRATTNMDVVTGEAGAALCFEGLFRTSCSSSFLAAADSALTACCVACCCGCACCWADCGSGARPCLAKAAERAGKEVAAGACAAYEQC